MRFMLMMNAPRGNRRLPDQCLVAGRPQGAHRVHERPQQRSQDSRRARRRRGLRAAGPGEARARRARTARPPSPTAPFAETKEFLAGYWIVDVETRRARVRDRRASVVGARTGWRAADHPDRSAPGDERAARRRVTATATDRRPVEHLLRELTPQVLGARRAAVRRLRRRRRRRAGSAHRRGGAVAGAKACPTIRAAGCITSRSGA